MTNFNVHVLLARNAPFALSKSAPAIIGLDGYNDNFQGSTRFPKKPMALIAGQSMLERVWRIAASVVGESQTLVATDSEEIAKLAQGFGAQVEMTSVDCRTGSDRVCEAVRSYSQSKGIAKEDLRILGFQGDAPLTPPTVLESLFLALEENLSWSSVTPAVILEGEALEHLIEDKSRGSSTGTLVVFDDSKRALYFSKSLVPFPRDGEAREVYKHIGIYAWRWPELENFVSLPKGRLEQIESLEQLRLLESGREMHVVEVDLSGRTMVSVDNPEDVARAEEVIAREGELL